MARSHTSPNLFCDYLDALHIPHTRDFSERQFRNMPFQTLFGLGKLLSAYGVQSEAYMLDDKSEFTKLTPPFLAHTPIGIVIVTSLTDGSVQYLSQGTPESMPLPDFTNAWDGMVMLSFPSSSASEPDYPQHRLLSLFSHAKKWILMLCVLFLAAYALIHSGLIADFWAMALFLFDTAGLYLTYLLVRKSLKIHSSMADRMCGILQAHGCDSILELKASKFFGLFGWSEVGFAYFSVSLFTLLAFPQALPELALCNICCLPFTFWSIWYQRFRARKWCTLCVCVQCTLWILFFCYLGGGWVSLCWPPTITFLLLGAAYMATMLGLNAIMPLIEHSDTDNSNP